MTLAQAYRLLSGQIFRLPIRKQRRAEREAEARVRSALSTPILTMLDGLVALGTEQGMIAYRCNLRGSALDRILDDHEAAERASEPTNDGDS